MLIPFQTVYGCFQAMMAIEIVRSTEAKIFIPWNFIGTLSILGYLQARLGNSRSARDSWPAQHCCLSNGLASPLCKTFLQMEPHHGSLLLTCCLPNDSSRSRNDQARVTLPQHAQNVMKPTPLISHPSSSTMGLLALPFAFRTAKSGITTSGG